MYGIKRKKIRLRSAAFLVRTKYGIRALKGNIETGSCVLDAAQDMRRTSTMHLNVSATHL